MYILPCILSIHIGISILCALLLFVFCFACVHLTRLTRIGWNYTKKQPPPPKAQTTAEKPAEKPPAPTAQPIYYLVERKRKTKTNYSEPKQIHFK